MLVNIKVTRGLNGMFLAVCCVLYISQLHHLFQIFIFLKRDITNKLHLSVFKHTVICVYYLMECFLKPEYTYVSM